MCYIRSHVVVGIRPNQWRGVSRHGGDRRGQWNQPRTMPNNLEWHIDIELPAYDGWCIIENRSNRTQPAGQLWRTRNIAIN